MCSVWATISHRDGSTSLQVLWTSCWLFFWNTDLSQSCFLLWVYSLPYTLNLWFRIVTFAVGGLMWIVMRAGGSAAVVAVEAAPLHLNTCCKTLLNFEGSETGLLIWWDHCLLLLTYSEEITPLNWLFLTAPEYSQSRFKHLTAAMFWWWALQKRRGNNEGLHEVLGQIPEDWCLTAVLQLGPSKTKVKATASSVLLCQLPWSYQVTLLSLSPPGVIKWMCDRHDGCTRSINQGFQDLWHLRGKNHHS